MKPLTQFEQPSQLTADVHARRENASEMLELLLALDRSLIEVSMQLYEVKQGDRRRMRMQNRRLHAAVRTQFPRLLKLAGRKTSTR